MYNVVTSNRKECLDTILIMAEVERYSAAEDLPQGRLEIIILQTKELSRPEKGRQNTI